MKRILPALLIVCLAAVVLCACRRSYRSDLERVDRVLSTDIPDTVEAHRLLDSVGASAGSFSEAERMYYIMLWADLQNKSFAPLPGDSLMRAMVGYYDRHGSANERMRAYYLLGSFYRDRNSQVEAQENFHKAVEAADTAAHDCDFRLLSRVYGQLADLYRYRTDLAVDMYNSVKYYALKGSDTLMSISAADNLIECYRDMHRHDTIIGIARWCQMMYERIGIPQKGNSLWLALSDAYVERSDFDSAAYCLRRYEQTSDMADDNYNVRPGMNRESYYTYKGDYYLAKGQTDSALIFYYKELHTNKEPYVSGAFRNLYRTYKRIGNKDSVIKYQTLYIRYRERRASKEAVSQLQELQVHFDVNRERARTEKFKGLSTFWKSTFTGLGIVFVMFLAAWGSRRRRLRRERKEWTRRYKRLEEDYYNKKLLVEDLTSDREAQQKLLDETGRELEALKAEKEAMENELSVRSGKEAMERRRAEVTRALHRAAASGKPLPVPNALWDGLDTVASHFAPRLIALMSERGLNEKEHYVTLLVWAWFTPMEMATLLSTSRQNITVIRERLYMKFFQQSGSAKDFDRHVRGIFGNTN